MWTFIHGWPMGQSVCYCSTTQGKYASFKSELAENLKPRGFVVFAVLSNLNSAWRFHRQAGLTRLPGK
jgi:hypothetical protein